MNKRIFRIAVLVFVLRAANASCQTDALTHAMHDRVEHFSVADPVGKELEDTKKTFAGYTGDRLANALIADLDVDRGSPLKNRTRNLAVTKLYHALKLPPTFVCKELKEAQSPKSKAALMTVLDGMDTPEVTAALLDQIKDRRPAEDYIGDPEESVEALRVCDIACNMLYYNLSSDAQKSPKLGFEAVGAERRDEIIKETLKELKLDEKQ